MLDSVVTYTERCLKTNQTSFVIGHCCSQRDRKDIYRRDRVHLTLKALIGL